MSEDLTLKLKSSTRIVKFEILHGTSANSNGFVRMINKYIADGWQPLGATVITPDFEQMVQTMVVYE